MSWRAYVCKLCGWRSMSFGSRTRIDYGLLDRAYADLLKHLREVHGIEADCPFPEYAKVEVGE